MCLPFLVKIVIFCYTIFFSETASTSPSSILSNLFVWNYCSLQIFGAQSDDKMSDEAAERQEHHLAREQDQKKQLTKYIEEQKETLRQLQMVKMYRKKVSSVVAGLHHHYSN